MWPCKQLQSWVATAHSGRGLGWLLLQGGRLQLLAQLLYLQAQRCQLAVLVGQPDLWAILDLLGAAAHTSTVSAREVRASSGAAHEGWTQSTAQQAGRRCAGRLAWRIGAC